MRLGIFEDQAVHQLEPLTLTRPAFALWCGAERLLDRQCRALNANEVGAWVRAAHMELTRLTHPDMPVNDPAWEPQVWVNARWLPPVAPRLDLSTPVVGHVGQEVAYIIGPPTPFPDDPEDVDAWLDYCEHALPHVPAEGQMLDYLWDIVDRNGDAVCQDWQWFHGLHGRNRKHGIAVMGQEDQLVVAEDANIEPCVVADTRQGPILIDRGATVHAFTRLEGPCYIGRESSILGAKLRGGSSIGPQCRIGGEVEASIVQGYSNKYHEGFLGHSFVGEWVNLAAATQTSDLRNDYGMIRLTINGERLATGRSKIGSYIGDHTKTGLGALLNTGSVVGACCNLLPSGTLLPQIVPSFCQVQYNQLQERYDLQKLFDTATTVMRRRGCEFSDVHKDFYYRLYEETADRRRMTIHESELRRLRRSV